MPNEVNVLMDRISEIMDKAVDELTAMDIDAIVDYHRKRRAATEGGGKNKKDEPSAKIDLAELGLKQAGPKFVRRI